MTLQEHLIENALIALEENESWDKAWNEFFDSKNNKEMSKQTQIKLEDIWDMANYVLYTWCSCCDKNT